MRDSFRQALSELFLGGAKQGESSASEQPTLVPSVPGTPPREPDAVIPAAVRLIDSASSRPAAGAEMTPDSSPAGEQFARMNAEMSSNVFDSASSVQQMTIADADGDDAATADTADETTMPPVFSADDYATAPADDSADPSTDEAGETDAEPAPPVRNLRPTIIAEGTEIKGTVTFGSNAEVYGVLHGDVTSRSNIVSNAGSIVGDVKANNMDMVNAELRGDVATTGDFRMNDKSTLTGNVEASRMDLRGTLTGDTTVFHELNVHSSAVVSGDIEAESIAIGHGARLRGFVNVGSDDDQ